VLLLGLAHQKDVVLFVKLFFLVWWGTGGKGNRGVPGVLSGCAFFCSEGYNSWGGWQNIMGLVSLWSGFSFFLQVLGVPL